jgi:hypothetical protein
MEAMADFAGRVTLPNCRSASALLGLTLAQSPFVSGSGPRRRNLVGQVDTHARIHTARCRARNSADHLADDVYLAVQRRGRSAALGGTAGVTGEWSP